MCMLLLLGTPPSKAPYLLSAQLLFQATGALPTADRTDPGMHVLQRPRIHRLCWPGFLVLCMCAQLSWDTCVIYGGGSGSGFQASCEFNGHTAHRIQQHVFTRASPLPRCLRIPPP